MTTRYAEGTEVSVDRSRVELETLLDRYGADAFAYLKRNTLAVITFEMKGRRIQMRLPLPDRNDKRFTVTPSGKWKRSGSEAQREYEKEVRRRWRALVLVVKAKLEAIESGISTQDEEFLSFYVVPGGMTVGETIKPHLDQVLASGKMPPLLPGGPHDG